ncbi:hypothetical protein HMI54_000773 [Coelomomyces lativittatus]|nr:hypothetical protein HMI56_001100 [Coelomomyces lativittatus]KAJ1511486.1 hypothetical protein HMI54_000773 [Coelomomyces lativittatus]KAJ1512601.1 hypothetical protein HMI55_006166 [Coelomomyces lativittatus]
MSYFKISTLFSISWLFYFFFHHIDCHFTILTPVRSRELQALPFSNEHFYPIEGGNTLRTVKNCLSFPKGEVANGQAGQTLTLKYLIGNGASHVGMCTAELYNSDTSQKIQDIGSLNNCMSKYQAMQVKLPDQACPHCVIRVKVIATHIPWAPETYDSCMDISISGSTRNPYAYDSSVGIPKDTPSYEVPSSPSPIYANYDPIDSSSNTCSLKKPYRCEKGGKSMYECVHETWLHRPLAPGTLCKLDQQGNLQIKSQVA